MSQDGTVRHGRALQSPPQSRTARHGTARHLPEGHGQRTGLQRAPAAGEGQGGLGAPQGAQPLAPPAVIARSRGSKVGEGLSRCLRLQQCLLPLAPRVSPLRSLSPDLLPGMGPWPWPWLAAVLAGLLWLRRWHRERQTVPGLSEKFVLITGCDSGFGNLLARQLDARGLRVLAGCLTEPGAAGLRAATSQRLQTVLLDVTSSHSIAAATAWVRERVGDRGLWGLVNNAGIAVPSAPNEWLSKDDFVKVLDVNLVGLIEVTLSLLPLVRRARGRVVNVASVVGRIALVGGGYCPSKYGVEAFSDSLRRELRDFGVKVSIIEPGCFQTSILDSDEARQSIVRAWDRAPDEVKQEYGQQYFQAYNSNFQRLIVTANPKLSLVTDAMEHALTAEYPRTRYGCGLDARLFYIPLSYLPSAWADRLLATSTT